MGGRLRHGRRQELSRDAEFQGIMPVRGKILNCLKADYGKDFQERDHYRSSQGPGLRRGGSRQACQGYGGVRPDEPEMEQGGYLH